MRYILRKELDGLLIFDRKRRRYEPIDNPIAKEIWSELITNKKLLPNNCYDWNRLFPDRVEKISIDEFKIIENPIPKNISLSAPVGVYFEISPKCNLDCSHCYQDNFPLSIHDSPLSFSEICNILDDLSNIGVFTVRFCGKDPSANPNIVEIVKYGKSLGLNIAIGSHGCFSSTLCNQLIDAGIDEVVISIDGNKEHHEKMRGKGTYEKAINSIKTFSSAGIFSRINMTVSQQNLSSVEEIANLAKNIGAYVSYIPMRVLGSAKLRMNNLQLTKQQMYNLSKQIVTLREKYKVRLLTYFDVLGETSDYYHSMFKISPCPAVKNGFIDSFGRVFPCDHLTPLGDFFYCGNVREKPYSKLWFEGNLGWEKYRALKNDDKCLGCNHFLKGCYGGCPSEELIKTKGLKTGDNLCFVNEKL